MASAWQARAGQAAPRGQAKRESRARPEARARGSPVPEFEGINIQLEVLSGAGVPAYMRA